MLEKNKNQIILSSFVVLISMLLGIILWKFMPDEMITHWGVGGVADRWSSKAFAVFGMPLIFLLTHWFCIYMVSRDPKNKGQNGKILRTVIWVIPVMSILTCGFTDLIALGYDIGINTVVFGLMGLMFILIGNYLPKCKQNYTIGVRVVWALQNEENWNKTHRFTGKLWVVGGFATLFGVFIPDDWMMMMYVLIGIALILSLMPIAYSYWYYRKQLAGGTASKEEGKLSTSMKTFIGIEIAVVILIVVFVMVLLFQGKYEVSLSDQSLEIHAECWSDVSVDLADITKIEYRQSHGAANRTNGFGTSSITMGECKNNEYGGYTRYTYEDCDACIVLTVDDHILMINEKTEEDTKALYDELSARIENK